MPFYVGIVMIIFFFIVIMINYVTRCGPLIVINVISHEIIVIIFLFVYIFIMIIVNHVILLWLIAIIFSYHRTYKLCYFTWFLAVIRYSM